MKKLLFVSNISNNVGSFVVASIAAAKKCGFEFYYAANWDGATKEQIAEDEKKYGIKIVHIDLDRSPYSTKNIKAYKQLVDLINMEKIDYIHCNTPVGGVLGRLAGEKCKVKKIVYEAHGFHFYEGAPKKNWMIYYPVEKWLAKKTDAIITINNEDFERAKTFKLKNNGQVYYVPGVGMDLSQYNVPDTVREIKRNELNLKGTDFALISMGDLIDRKNYKIAIEVVAKLNNPHVHYFICGKGPEEVNLKKLAENLGVDKQVHFLGFRNDIKELLKASDTFLFTSKQEGLARSLMEAMASKIPCVVSKIRGNTELIVNNENGFLCSGLDDYVNAIIKIMQSPDLAYKFKEKSSKHLNNFSIEKVIDCLFDVYSKEYR
ncbi:glycosyltransferase family 1 protein [Catenibacterium sp. AM22-15]|uniref:glycosyltransferase family 4 protein n=1 Tax=unclassified Catenibacterium TaxID=2643636 RepID=UPI000E3F0C3F|nr:MULTISPECIES: glycosyltransferase family 4 protein [unclassified Catenibacterium]RGE98276.1 glycosyltransferase family 1 protein [Catenibacterium sp. AM22-6LB]RGF07519.1 glycosyltransferase family 1 protein [Catenibacterium sp. AM22-15]